jgi:hypothetical protein
VSQPLVVDDTEENFCLKVNIIILFSISDKEVALAGNKSIVENKS